jgi:flagellar M-ring protein FliF
MPPQLQALLANKRLLAIIGGVVALLLIVSVVFMVMRGGGEKNAGPGDALLNKEQKTLAKVTSLGKAIEIQALLARQGIHVNYDDAEGDTKIKINFDDKARLKDRDKALITLVQSGLMDNNVGLESFDKGDLTASREEKRIKLIRAQQGELARLIKKIDPVEDAAVSIAIPEQTIFRTDEKPVTASVQVSLPSGTMLNHDQVRAITNLVVGSVQGLTEKHLSISDTNGHTYSSILESGADMDEKIREQDNYMRQKVATQLDRLVGAGNYVVTVSTELRQARREMMVEQFDPQGAVVSAKQAFNENLNNRGASPGAGGPASSFLPGPPGSPLSGALGAVTGSVGGTSPGSQGSGKDYLRNGVEVNYSNSRTQWLETSPVGMTEDITVAVTIDHEHFPADLSVNELQTLIARAASPKVRPESVSIARTDMRTGLPLGETRPESAPSAPVESPADLSWLYWAGGAVGVCVLLMILLGSRRKEERSPLDETFLQTQQEMQQLRELASQQQAQIQATQQQTQMLMEVQQRQMEQLQARAPDPAIPSGPADMSAGESGRFPGELELQRTLEELRDVVGEDADDEEALDFQIKSWIESS